MSSKHTPGPWKVFPEEAHRDYVRVRGTALGRRFKIANVPTPIHEGVTERDVEETRANARLIAAAPELLAALIKADQMFRDIGFVAEADRARPGSLGAEIRAAIAKATGEGA
ncbi:TPA: hypothetical protein UL931_000330 [Stenotrophomonas maltophilia]|nr:hypothetical protein [Stenotrophomonas maltophilia]